MRRALLVAAGTVVLAAGLVGFALLLGGRDDARVVAGTGPGRAEPDRGARHLPAGQSASVPAGELPTSGSHRPEPVTADERRLSDDQVIHALELGDVVILYDAPRPAAALTHLQQAVAGPFDAALAAAGQAVILARRPGAGPATALAWRRSLRAADSSDPALRAFADAWLGRGA
jgi:hypothetical protein